jgi:hypothetical protein
MGKHGGARQGAGRKPKADEERLIEKMENVLSSDKVLATLAFRVQEGDIPAIKLWLSYRYGMPSQSVDLTSGGKKIEERPLIVFTNGDKSQ